MMDLLDAMSELVYIVDIETYDLLYMNASGRAQFKLNTLKGRKCYEVIQGRQTPCEFCSTPYLKSDAFYTWEMTNPITNRHYLLKDKLYPWEDRMARIEIAFDLTEKQASLEAETLLLNCVETLFLEGQFSKKAGKILQMLGEFSMADRTCAFEMEDSRVVDAYEWCNPLFPKHADKLRGQLLNQPNVEAILGKETPVILYPLPTEDCLPMQGRNVCIAVAGSSVAQSRYLQMVMKTLANFMTSILQVERYQKQLEHLSFVDPLTGAFNRNAFIKDIEKDAVASTQPAGIVQISVNGIKDLNDRNGREYGDQVLVNTARMLQSAMPPSRVYRVGGDEFIVVWKNVDGETFEGSIRKIKTWQEWELTAKCALGYQWVGQDANLQEIASKAEEQMYQNKREFYRDAAMPKRYRSFSDKVLDFADESDLKQMLVDQRFTVYFQPKFSVSDHTLIGAEALVRFVTDTGKFLPPDQFIPFLEEAHLIERVDFYVFGFVCAKLAEWIAEGKQIVPISVNFSRYTIKEPWFHDTLLVIWEKYNVPKNYVEIEITEGAEENCGDSLLDLLTQLRQDGFLVSIDDFGVKYANLSIFTNGNFSTLKVDKSLISDWENPRTKEILRVLCEICQRTDVCMIAEGVELQEQLDFLEQINCEGVQGFLFSHPLPLREYERLYLNRLGDGLTATQFSPHSDQL